MPPTVEPVEIEPYSHLWTPTGAREPITIPLHPTLATSLDRLETWGVYLICASGKISDHAQHYTGYAQRSILERVSEHLLGTCGCHLPAAYLKAGMTMRLARVWEHRSRHFERAVKLRASAPSLCPFCNPGSWWANEIHPKPDQLLRYRRYQHLWPEIAARLGVPVPNTDR